MTPCLEPGPENRVCAMGRPTLLLDLDDVVCLQQPYGAYDVIAPGEPPSDLYERLFDTRAKEVLLQLMREHGPRVAITSSWTRFMDRERIHNVLRLSGLKAVADAMAIGAAWEAPQATAQTRATAIEGWLAAHGGRAPFVVLDDALSGTGLAKSRLRDHVVWCDVGVGLQEHHLDEVRAILRRQP